MTSKRKRGQNFAAEEKDRLVKILFTYKDIILNKKTDGPTNEAKNKAWVDVTNAFNTSATVYRTKESLMKVWEKLKTESKRYSQSDRQSLSGSGPVEVKIDPILEQVHALLSLGCTRVSVEDSDATFSTRMENLYPVVKILEDQEKEDINGECKKQEILYENNYISSQTNERSETSSSICTNFKNKKKKDIEELRRQLLEEEIHFKRKLHNLQLQAAMMDVEIKNEILNQLKGGTITLQHLLSGTSNKESPI